MSVFLLCVFAMLILRVHSLCDNIHIILYQTTMSNCYIKCNIRSTANTMSVYGYRQMNNSQSRMLLFMILQPAAFCVWHLMAMISDMARSHGTVWMGGLGQIMTSDDTSMLCGLGCLGKVKCNSGQCPVCGKDFSQCISLSYTNVYVLCITSRDVILKRF